MSYVHVISNLTTVAHARAAFVERRKLSLATLARRRGLNPRAVPVICARNGKWIKQSQWRRVVARRDDVVTFIVMPRGQYARVGAMLALLVVATVVSGGLAGAGLGAIPGLALTGNALSVGTALIGAGIVTAGSYLINVLMPSATSSASEEAASSSSTYASTLSAQNNQARLNGPIPVLYGRLRFIPDLAASAWSEWNNKVQSFHQTLVLTQGQLEIHKIELGQTDIASYGSDVEWEVIAPGAIATLFEPEVFTSQQVSGSVLYAPNDPDSGLGITSSYVNTTTYPAGQVVFTLNTANGDQHFYQSITGGNVGHLPPNAAWWTDLGITPPFEQPFMGPFPVCPPGTTTSKIGIDLALPQGLYVVNDTTGGLDAMFIQWRLEYRQIDDAGTALSGWATLHSEVAISTGAFVTPTYPNTEFRGGGYQYPNQRSTPVTFSLRVTMPFAARWEVRAIRVSEKQLTFGQVGHDLTWIGLKSFLTPVAHGDVTGLAVRIKSTSAANNASSHQIAVTATRSLPNYAGPGTVTTRSIALALIDVLTNQTYGGRRPLSALDLDRLEELYPIWEGRGDTFDFYAAEKSTLWDALTSIGRAGRTVPYHQSGVVRFHRDAPQTIPAQLFSNENIVKGSFKLKFAMPAPDSDTDGVEVKYISETTGQLTSILLPKAGVDVSISPSSVTLDGVIKAAHAQREAEYMLAADQFRRVFTEFDTDMEGMIVSRGDLILVHHDMPRWGESHRVLAYDAASKTVTLWGRVMTDRWDYAQFRDSLGRPSQPVIVASYDTDHQMTLLTAPIDYNGNPFDMTQHSEASPLHMVIGKIESTPRRAVFLSASPRSGNQVSISAVLEDERVHVN